MQVEAGWKALSSTHSSVCGPLHVDSEGCRHEGSHEEGVRLRSGRASPFRGFRGPDKLQVLVWRGPEQAQRLKKANVISLDRPPFGCRLARLCADRPQRGPRNMDSTCRCAQGPRETFFMFLCFDLGNCDKATVVLEPAVCSWEPERATLARKGRVAQRLWACLATDNSSDPSKKFCFKLLPFAA